MLAAALGCPWGVSVFPRRRRGSSSGLCHGAAVMRSQGARWIVHASRGCSGLVPRCPRRFRACAQRAERKCVPPQRSFRGPAPSGPPVPRTQAPFHCVPFPGCRPGMASKGVSNHLEGLPSRCVSVQWGEVSTLFFFFFFFFGRRSFCFLPLRLFLFRHIIPPFKGGDILYASKKYK